MKNFPIDPTTFIYGAIAVCGGIARYLRGYVDGSPFSVAVLFASAFISGFGGWMFAIMGSTMNLPEPILYVMAGIGGFFSDQTFKLVFEYTTGKIK